MVGNGQAVLEEDEVADNDDAEDQAERGIDGIIRDGGVDQAAAAQPRAAPAMTEYDALPDFKDQGQDRK